MRAVFTSERFDNIIANERKSLKALGLDKSDVIDRDLGEKRKQLEVYVRTLKIFLFLIP